MPTADETRMKVQRILASNGTVELSGDDLFIKMGSTVAKISVLDWGDGNTLVRINAPILFDVPVSDALYKYVAQNSNNRFFGALGLAEGDDGTAVLFMDQTLLGDTLDEPELMFAAVLVAETADRLDDELKPRFGGKRLVDFRD